MLCRYPKLLTVTLHFGFEPTLLISYTRLENKYNTKYIIVIQNSIFRSILMGMVLKCCAHDGNVYFKCSVKKQKCYIINLYFNPSFSSLCILGSKIINRIRIY